MLTTSNRDFFSALISHVSVFLALCVFRYQQYTGAKIMAICDQLALDLMGVDKNVYEDQFGGLNEDGVMELFVREKNFSQLNVLYQKIKYVNYMCGDMDEAVKYYDLHQEVSLSLSKNIGECIYLAYIVLGMWSPLF